MLKDYYEVGGKAVALSHDYHSKIYTFTTYKRGEDNLLHQIYTNTITTEKRALYRFDRAKTLLTHQYINSEEIAQ